MEFVELTSAAIQLAQTVKKVCDKVRSNKDKCGLLAKLSDEVGAILQKHFGNSQKAAKWEQDKVVFARVETIRFCLKNAQELIQNYLGEQGIGKGLLVVNAINIDAKFQKVIDDLKDAERQLVQAVSMDAAANQGNTSEILKNQRYMKEFLEAAERDRQRDVAAIREDLNAIGRNDEEQQRKLEVLIELLMKQSVVSFNSPPSPSCSMNVSVVSGKSDTDYAYFITPDCIEYERSSKKTKGDNRVKLGQGGFGTVYKATLRRSLPIAVKILDDSATNKAALDELRKEIRIMSCLSHPNIICFLGGYYPTTQTKDNEDEEEEAYLVMELAENKSLAYHLGMLKGNNVQQLSKSTKMKILTGLADGLYYLHMQKIVHRDIKPDNVLLNREFEAKLSDFGLAKVKQTSLSSKSHAGAVGTLGYQSPETMRNEKMSFPADIWSFGIVMIECMIHERVYAGKNLPQVYDIVCIHKKVPLDRIKTYESQWPTEYVELIKSCLSFDVKRRPTAMDVSVRMRGIMEHSTSTAGYVSSLDGLTLGKKPGTAIPVSLVSAVTAAASSSSTSTGIPASNVLSKPKTLSKQEIKDLFQRGEDFYFGTNGNKVNYTSAVEWYRRAANQGLAEAQYNLGNCYYNGQGVAQDYKQAVEWYRKAANQGLVEAQCGLGVCYHLGQGAEHDYRQAVEWYQKAANQGYANAQSNIAFCFEKGQGVPQDYKQAVEWYQKAANQGYAQAQCGLGNCYLFGRGAARDCKRSVEWYQEAANQGYPQAQCGLGNCYHFGQGVEKDYIQAVHWYQLAANQGDGIAQYNLGNHYRNGKGVIKNVEEAKKWYLLAADQGQQNAKNALSSF